MVLSIVGAAIDFVTANFFFSQSMSVTNGMGMLVSNHNQYAIEWSVVLFALGGLLVVTSLLGVSHFGVQKMNIFGGLMMLYGATMIFLGVLMFSGMSPMMNGSLYSSLAMLVVGFLMILNGALMLGKYSRKTMHSMKAKDVSSTNETLLTF